MTNYKDIKRIPIVAADVPNLAASKITSGTLDNARITLDAAEIPNLDTAKTTTGTFADARISAGSVTQHVTATDLVPLKQDIATLALHSAIADNKTAYNLPNFFIDQFEDDTGILTETDGDRDASEYWSTVSIGTADYTTDSFSSGDRTSLGITVTNEGTDGVFYSFSANATIDGNTASGSGSGLHWLDIVGDRVKYDFGSGNEKIVQAARHYAADTQSHQLKMQGSSDGTNWTDLTAVSVQGIGSPIEQWVTSPTNTTAYRYYSFLGTTHGASSGGAVKEIEFKIAPLVSNATGTLISNAQTASSATTKLSGVFLYKDNAGTATLGTDLKVYLSADNGSNFTEIPSYGTVSPLFSTGIKMIRMPETTVTSGTSIKLKAVWANQSSGSKETQLHGWAVNY